MTDAALLDALRALDTPTVCNALERVAPDPAQLCFTRGALVCVHPALPPMVGYARTAKIRAAHASGRSPDADREALLGYYRHIAEPPHPTVTVVEDVDAEPGTGAWWGEVHTNLHRGLGSLGAISNGSVRDLDQVAPDFQVLAGSVGPSHAFVHPVETGRRVTVAGMTVQPGDLIHADRHGACVLPSELAPRLADAARAVVAEERVLIDASRGPEFSIAVLERLLRDVHH